MDGDARPPAASHRPTNQRDVNQDRGHEAQPNSDCEGRPMRHERFLPLTKSIVDLYPRGVKVDKCYEVTDSLVTTYSCRVRATVCTRSILFAVVTDSRIAQASLRRETDATTATPCAIPTSR
jgi:hypothetical protein